MWKTAVPPRVLLTGLDAMKTRLLITGLVIAALLLALYGLVFGTGATREPSPALA